jgi:hypothetical protein
MSYILSLSLALTPVGHLFEPIRVHGALELRAEYLDVGRTVDREMMALSIEDFALLQSELEVTSEAWDSRVKSLVEEHKRSYLDLQAQLTLQKTQSALALSEKDVLIKSANLRALEAEGSLENYKLAIILTTVVASGVIVFLAAGD